MRGMCDREQLLMVLLRVVSVVMPTEVPSRRADCLAGRLAQPLFQVCLADRFVRCILAGNWLVI